MQKLKITLYWEILMAELTQICFLENFSRSFDDVGRVRLFLHHNSFGKLQPSPALRLLEGDQVFYNKYKRSVNSVSNESSVRKPISG